MPEEAPLEPSLFKIEAIESEGYHALRVRLHKEALCFQMAVILHGELDAYLLPAMQQYAKRYSEDMPVLIVDVKDVVNGYGLDNMFIWLCRMSMKARFICILTGLSERDIDFLELCRLDELCLIYPHAVTWIPAANQKPKPTSREEYLELFNLQKAFDSCLGIVT